MLPDDLKHGAEGDDAFRGFSLGWPQVLALLAALIVIGLVLDGIERTTMKAIPQTAISARPAQSVTTDASNSAVLPLSHPLRGPDCDVTITQRSAGAWGPERCARGVRK
jgi:hypothetical protein